MTTALRTCCIPGCKSMGLKDGEKLCAFPQAPDRRQTWIEYIRQSGCVAPSWDPTPTSYVCQIHFEESCFIQESETAPPKMARGANPTIFPEKDSVPKVLGKPNVSIIRTRSAAGIMPKPKVAFDAGFNVRARRESPQSGHTFKPVITRATGEVRPTIVSPKTTSVVVIATDQPKLAMKRALPTVNIAPPKKINMTSCGNCLQMQEKLNQKSTVIRDLEVKIADLKQELNQQDSTRTAAASKIERLKESLKEIYTKHQMARLTDGTTRGRPWDMETVRRAAKLVLACGRNGYQEILNQGQPFPSLKTLNRLLYKRRYLSSTLDNPDPQIASELREEMSDTDPEDESEGSAEEIEENIVAGEEGRILKKSRKTRKSRNSLQKCNEAFQDIQAAQAVHSLDASEAAVLEEVEGITEGQLLLQHIDPLGDIVEADAQALASQYGQLTVIQDSSGAPALSGEVIEDILRAQNLTAAEVKEIRVEGSYITIVKHQDSTLQEDDGMMSQDIIS